MWTEETMSFADSLVVSLLGLSVVFLMLLTLLVAILIISWIIRGIFKEKADGAHSINDNKNRRSGNDTEDEENAVMMAALLAAVSEDTKIAPTQLKIKNIRQL